MSNLLKKWRNSRLLRPFQGMYNDVRRRLPYYWSDIRDALTYRTLASTVRIYFVNILPAIAYTLDMHRKTGGFYGINESLFSSALAGLVFSLLGAQPITIVGITGLISLFNYTIYDIIIIYKPSIYPRFMCWTGIWGAIFHWLVAVFNLCDYMRFVTDFSSQSFAAYVGIIYCIKGVEELVSEFSAKGAAAGFMGCMIAILYSLTVYSLQKLGISTVFRVWFRTLLADYAFPIATIFWVGFSHIPGNLKSTPISFVPTTTAFFPTQPRNWLIPFWDLEARWIGAAAPFGFLVMLLFYFDHNVSSLTAQARNFPLKKPAGFHWDFFLLGCTTFIAGVIGIPMPNGLVPQAPVHTDSLAIYGTEVQVISTGEGEGAEIRSPVTKPTAIVEQRISHLLMALAIVGTMTGPLLVVLSTMPNAVFAGVFFIVGFGAIESNGILHRAVWLLLENRFIRRNEPLLRMRKKKILLFIACQAFGVAISVAISQTIAAIGFPVLIIALIPVRIWIMSRLFTTEELEIMDDLTANNSIVLASLGGAPSLPGRDELRGEARRYVEQRRGHARQRAASIPR